MLKPIASSSRLTENEVRINPGQVAEVKRASPSCATDSYTMKAPNRDQHENAGPRRDAAECAVDKTAGPEANQRHSTLEQREAYPSPYPIPTTDSRDTEADGHGHGVEPKGEDERGKLQAGAHVMGHENPLHLQATAAPHH